ncbi:hypothetical protein JCM3765_001088 [Sporobolomyces pararoseus]
MALEKVSNWTKLDNISTWSSELVTVPLFSSASETSDSVPQEAWQGVKEYANQQEHHEAIVKWVEAFKGTSHYRHIHPLAKLCQTREKADTVADWKRCTSDVIFANARTRFTPWEAYTVFASTQTLERFQPVEKATLNLHREEYRSIWWSQQVPKEVEKYLIDLVYRYVCQDSTVDCK